MLSFFSKKKQSPETPPGDIIKGPSDGNGDDFIIVDNQQPGAPAPFSHRGAPAAMMPPYPYPPAGYGLPPPNNNNSTQAQQNQVPYLLGIPFNLSPQLCTKTSFEVTQMEVDGILALMTKQMQFESDYDFKLERGILMGTKNELLSVSSECDEGTTLDNGFDVDDEVRRYFKWSTESTKLLLSLRFHQDSAFSNPKSKKKQLWDSVAADMYRIGGYRISGVLCDLKFRNMLHTYKKNRAKENSGNSNVIVWEYYKLFKDAVGHKFNKSRSSNFTDSMLYEDTMLEPPNETMEAPDEPPNESDRNLESNRVNQDDSSTVEFQPHNSSKRKINESSFNGDEDCNNTAPHHSADMMVAQTLTEDERNECTAFGHSVATQLQTIKDSYSRALTKLKMQKILFLAQTGRLALNNERL